MEYNFKITLHQIWRQQSELRKKGFSPKYNKLILASIIIYFAEIRTSNCFPFTISNICLVISRYIVIDYSLVFQMWRNLTHGPISVIDRYKIIQVRNKDPQLDSYDIITL